MAKFQLRFSDRKKNYIVKISKKYDNETPRLIKIAVFEVFIKTWHFLTWFLVSKKLFKKYNSYFLIRKILKKL